MYYQEHLQQICIYVFSLITDAFCIKTAVSNKINKLLKM